MDLPTYLKAIRKSWWIVVVLVLAGTAGGVLMTARATPAYVSTVTFFVATPTESTGTPSQAQLYAQRRINSYMQLLKTQDFARQVIAKSGVDLSVAQVQAGIDSSTDLNTVLLTVTATNEVPQRSLAIATAVATEFGSFVGRLDTRTATQTSPVVLNVLSGPTLNPTPVSPRPTLNLGLGILLGLGLGLAVAVFRQLQDSSIRSRAELAEVSGLPVLGAVPADSSARSAPLLVGSQATSPRAEAFRQLRTSVQLAQADKPMQVVVVTSAVAGEGKSTTAANLAIVAAESGRRVLLVEADMRRPRLAEYFGLDRTAGLSTVLAKQASAIEVMRPWGSSGLMVMPSGGASPNPSEMLGSTQVVELIDSLRNRFDLILVDTPPLLPVTDAAVASTWADGVLLTVRNGKASRAKVVSALQSLAAVEAHVLGTVFTMSPRPRRRL